MCYDIFQILAEHTRDPALFIRKLVITSLTVLLETYPDSNETIDKWVIHVMPLILDPESKVQEKVVEVTVAVMISYKFTLIILKF